MNTSSITYADCCYMCFFNENKHNDCYCSIWFRYVSTFAICPKFVLNEKFAEYRKKESPFWFETRYPEANKIAEELQAIRINKEAK